jgi:MinD-like ATPase involved in chromosome partitioning or flagellar assembly
MTLSILTAADGAGWEAALLAQLGAGAGGLAVSRRCVDVVELVAVASSGQARAALVDAQLRRLDPDVVDRLHAVGVAVVGVTVDGSQAETARLNSCGIRFSVPADASVAAVRAVLDQAMGERAGTDPAAGERAFAVPVRQAAPAGMDLIDSTGASPEPRSGKVVAVWGPTGAPGRTTVAANLAAELGLLGASSLLIDLDVYGGVLGNVFGLLDDSPGLVAACRQAQGRRLDPARLAALCWQISPAMRVLTGISRADRWPELRPAAVEAVLEVARGMVEYTVLDLGFAIDSDEELSFDTVAPRRNGATLAALAAADLVLVIGSAEPTGMQRLVRGLTELRDLGLAAPSWVVLNRVRDGVIAGSTDTELTDALRRFTGRPAAALLPYDLDGLDRALRDGRTLSESAPQSPLRHALVELASAISGRPAPTGRGGRRSRTQARTGR